MSTGSNLDLPSTAERSTEEHKHCYRVRERMQHTSTLISLGSQLFFTIIFSSVCCGLIQCYFSHIGFNRNILFSSISYLRLSSSFRVYCKPTVGKSTVRPSSFIVTSKFKICPSAPICLCFRSWTSLVPSHVSSVTCIQPFRSQHS